MQFATYVSEYGFFGWPVSRVVGNTMALDLRAASLAYRVATDFEDWEVVPRFSISFAHAQLRGDVPPSRPRA